MDKYKDKTPEECEIILELINKSGTTDEENEKIHQFLGNIPASDEDSERFFSEFRNGYA